MDQSWRCVPRFAALLAFPSGAAPSDSNLRECAELLRASLPGDSRVRIGVRVPDDPISAGLAQRGATVPIDAVLEVTLSESAPAEELMAAARPLGGLFGKLIDPAGSELLAGIAHLIVEGDGPILLAIAGRRHPDISIEGVRRWWIDQHSVLVRQIIRPFPSGYEQLHVDRDLSRRVADAAGFSPQPYDLFDSINGSSVSGLMEPVLDPEVARRLYEDELGHVDHRSFRAATCRVL